MGKRFEQKNNQPIDDQNNECIKRQKTTAAAIENRTLGTAV